jgi:hypothetical protein
VETEVVVAGVERQEYPHFPSELPFLNILVELPPGSHESREMAVRVKTQKDDKTENTTP